MALNANALTTLIAAKEHLRITGSAEDTRLEQIINGVSDAVERICGRKFLAGNYSEFVRAQRDEAILIRNWPLIRLDRVATGSDTAIEMQYTGSDFRATVSVDDVSVRLQSISVAGVTTSTQLLFSTYPSTDVLSTAISAVSGWTATKREDALSSNLHRTNESAKDRIVSLYWPQHDDITFEAEYESGQIFIHGDYWRTHTTYVRGRFAGLFLIEYRGGFETIPDDLEQTALDTIKETWEITKINASLQSESLGDYSYTTGGGSNISMLLTAKMERLAPWFGVNVARKV